MRGLELPRPFALRLADGLQVLAVAGKLLHESAHGGDPNPVLLIDTDADRGCARDELQTKSGWRAGSFRKRRDKTGME